MGALTVTPSGQACGATVTGIDFAEDLHESVVKEIRDAWLEHHVLAFPNQNIDDDQLERFALRFGVFGDDGFFGPIEGREHIAAIRREAEDTQPIFADMWHSDWSFQEDPPAATFLYGIDIPPVGGDTLFVNNHLAFEEMPAELLQKFEGKTAIHSAVMGYAPDGPFGDPKRQPGVVFPGLFYNARCASIHRRHMSRVHDRDFMSAWVEYSHDTMCNHVSFLCDFTNGGWTSEHLPFPFTVSCILSLPQLHCVKLVCLVPWAT